MFIEGDQTHRLTKRNLLGSLLIAGSIVLAGCDNGTLQTPVRKTPTTSRLPVPPLRISPSPTRLNTPDRIIRVNGPSFIPFDGGLAAFLLYDDLDSEVNASALERLSKSPLVGIQTTTDMAVFTFFLQTRLTNPQELANANNVIEKVQKELQISIRYADDRRRVLGRSIPSGRFESQAIGFYDILRFTYGNTGNLPFTSLYRTLDTNLTLYWIDAMKQGVANLKGLPYQRTPLSNEASNFINSNMPFRTITIDPDTIRAIQRLPY